jgi:membrane protease YdiL (CAAX protease family)
MTDRRGTNAIALTIAVLVFANVMANRVLTAWATVPWNLATAIVLLVIARRVGVSAADLGLDRVARVRGWRVGRWFALATFVVMAIGLLLPTTRELFEDGRIRSLSWIEVAYHAAIAVPLGTVLLEEVAFRGVVPALFAPRLTRLRSNVAASMLFGLWHVLPAWDIYRVNPVLRDVLHGTGGRVVGVTVGAVSTVGIGMLWCWLRDRSGSLLTTMIVHISTNSLGYVFAFIAWSIY